MKESARIDKWLWAARIYKTRSIAADACKNGRVMVGGVTRKPSFIIKRGDVVSVKKAPITYSFEVLDCIEQRVGAKMLYGVYKNVTDPKQYELLEMSRISGFVDRARGTGRRLLGLRFGALTPPLNLPAPGRRHPIYIIFRFSIELCFC